MRNRFGRGASALLATVPLLLAGCAVGEESGASETLNFAIWSNGGDTARAYDELVDGFEQANPGVHVNLETFNTTDYDTVLKSRLAGGAGPDVYGFDQKNLADFIAAGYSADLAQEPWLARLSADAREEAGRNAPPGQAHYVPISRSGNGIVYNTALFAQAGIEGEPQTFDELLAASKKLKAAGITPFAMSAQENWWPQFIFYYATAQHVYGVDPDFNEKLMAGRTSFTQEPGWRNSLEIFQRLVPYFMENPLGTNQTAAQSAFLNGEAAMFPAPSILSAAREAGLELGYFNFPTTDTPDTEVMWGSYLVSLGINPQNGKQELASRFVDHLLSEPQYTRFLTTAKAFPVIDGVDVSAADPLFRDMQQSWEGHRFATLVMPLVPGMPEVILPELQNLIAGRSTTQEVLDRLQATVDEARASDN